MSYLGKFSPSTPEVCEPLQKLTSLKCYWTWDNTYQNLYGKSKNIKNAAMAFYNEKQQLYSDKGIRCQSRASPLQVRDGMQFQRNKTSNNVLQPIAFAHKS